MKLSLSSIIVKLDQLNQLAIEEEQEDITDQYFNTIPEEHQLILQSTKNQLINKTNQQ